MTAGKRPRRGGLARLAGALGRLWRRLAERLFLRPWRIEAAVSEMDEVPVRIPARRAVLVASGALRKWLVFDCPCGAGHRVLLNLDRRRRPFWTLRLGPRRRITLDPSVDQREGRRSCHYFLSNGRVEWARTAPAPARYGERLQRV